ncbi:antA/AntB antirepressor family protein [Halomonas sp. SL1]|uniref:antA/AntB antirepressor family protein n=1 Tax=Halomonas sp. SL1 TaxID=2137478 RepID=UPI000D15953B|nr:antA/AntB antirepressor family protein [Halomonas sp. SL1]RAH36512.1 hypothetical protein C9J49_015860 [Halomonas sp. SL1]
MTKTTRNGRSIVTDINHVPKKTLTSVLGFADEQAKRMMKARRVLPIVEDRQEPQIDARKLWEKIGKPHKQFNKWADHYINPLMAPDNFGEKSPKTCADEIEHFSEHTGKQGRPKTNYLLSRDVAAHLAMQANTAEGHDIRCYFLDMEDCVLRMERYRPIRTEHLTEIDNSVYHRIVSETGSTVYAQDAERFLKGMVAEAVSGMSASEWREALNEIPGARGKGIRDVLDGDDLRVYRDALQFAASLLHSGATDRDQIESMVRSVHADKVHPDKYLHGSDHHQEAA